jgi:hypothetical protein
VHTVPVAQLPNDKSVVPNNRTVPQGAHSGCWATATEAIAASKVTTAKRIVAEKRYWCATYRKDVNMAHLDKCEAVETGGRCCNWLLLPDTSPCTRSFIHEEPSDIFYWPKWVILAAVLAKIYLEHIWPTSQIKSNNEVGISSLFKPLCAHRIYLAGSTEPPAFPDLTGLMSSEVPNFFLCMPLYDQLVSTLWLIDHVIAEVELIVHGSNW